MVQFWSHWWFSVAGVSLLSGTVWAVCALVFMPISEGVQPTLAVTPQERRLLRYLGWGAAVAGPSLPSALPEVPAVRAYCEPVEQSVRAAHKANRARFAIPMTLAWLGIAAGISQLVLTYVCLLPEKAGGIWLLASLGVAALGAAPWFVTIVLLDRHWERRKPFEWRLYEQAVRVQRALNSRQLVDANGRASVLDPVERTLIERFARSPIDLPSQRERAQRWQKALTRVTRDRPDLSLVPDPRAAASRWLGECYEVALSSGKKIGSVWPRIGLGKEQQLERRPPLKHEGLLRLVWGTLVLVANLVVVICISLGDRLGTVVSAVGAAVSNPPLVASATLISVATPLLAAMVKWAKKLNHQMEI